jgi:hypothetical protein
MVGVALLTMLTLSAALVSVPISRQARSNREVAMGNTEAIRILERVHAVPFSKITTIYPDGIVIPVASLPSGTVAIQYDDPSADPLVLRATLAWASSDIGQIQRTFHTVITR